MSRGTFARATARAGGTREAEGAADEAVGRRRRRSLVGGGRGVRDVEVSATQSGMGESRGWGCSTSGEGAGAWGERR